MSDFTSLFQTHLGEHQEAILKLNAMQDQIAPMAAAWLTALQSGKKILFFGNGGSAADAQHLAAELVVRYRVNRPALAGIALTTIPPSSLHTATTSASRPSFRDRSKLSPSRAMSHWVFPRAEQAKMSFSPFKLPTIAVVSPLPSPARKARIVPLRLSWHSKLRQPSQHAYRSAIS